MKRRFFLLFFALMYIMLIFNTDVLIESFVSSINLLLYRLIPTLSPFILLTNIFIYVSEQPSFPKAAEKLFKRIFRLPGSYIFPLIIGCISGFPVGAAASAEIYERNNSNSKEELEKAITLTSVPGPSLPIAFIGIGLFGDVKIGVLYYFSGLISNIFAYLTALKICGYERIAESSPVKKATPSKTFSQLINQALFKTLQSCVTISLYVVFFSLLTALLQESFSYIGLSKENLCFAFLSGIFEITGGAVNVFKALGDNAIIPIAFLFGFNGMSIHFQTISLLSKHHIKFGFYFIQKLISSVFTGIIAAATSSIFFKTACIPIIYYVSCMLILFLFSGIISFVHKKRLAVNRNKL